MQLTKDADKMICRIYATYLQLRKNGVPKSKARKFEENYFSKNDAFSSWSPSDCDSTLAELQRAGLVKTDILGDFTLTDSAIIYMENRFVNGLKEVIEYVTKFIP
nr:MAG TPA: ribonuclease R [Bacteriophage sp.]